MRPLTLRRAVPLEVYLPEPVYYLNEIRPRWEYVEGKMTGKILGFNYTVTNIDSYDQITVFVPGTDPVIPIEQLIELHDEGQKAYVELVNPLVRPYFNEALQAVADSIKAEDIKLVEDI